jgi:predicted metalloenzyme YecM
MVRKKRKKKASLEIKIENAKKKKSQIFKFLKFNIKAARCGKIGIATNKIGLSKKYSGYGNEKITKIISNKLVNEALILIFKLIISVFNDKIEKINNEIEIKLKGSKYLILAN